MTLDKDQLRDLTAGLVDICSFVMEMYSNNSEGIGATLLAAKSEKDEEDRIRRDTYLDLYMYLGLLDQLVQDMAVDINSLAEELDIDL